MRIDNKFKLVVFLLVVFIFTVCVTSFIFSRLDKTNAANNLSTYQAVAAQELTQVETTTETNLVQNQAVEPVEEPKTTEKAVTTTQVQTAQSEPTPEPQPEPVQDPMLNWETCSMSWHDSIDRATTLSGENFDANSLTAAHRSLPFGTVITIEYQGNSIDVVVNDRTSQSFGRCLDITSGAFSRLAPLSSQVIITNITIH